MKLNKFQYQAAREAFINNSVFDNIKLWIEDGQITEAEIKVLIEEIFKPVEIGGSMIPLEYLSTNQPVYAMDVILAKQEIYQQEKENAKPCGKE